MTTPYDAALDRFHVQTTTPELHGQFPNFAYHQSVARLWSELWRKPATAGLYPFFDGKVADFDPIFADLIARSEGSSTILTRPDEYAAAFLPMGQALVTQAQAAERQDRPADARDLYMRAAAVYRIARFPVVRTPRSDEAWELGKAAYEKAGALMDMPVLPVAVPFARADVKKGDTPGPIPAYLRLPSSGKPASGWPVLLFICGLDSYRTDNTMRLDGHLRDGFATLIFEIPGTGDCPASPEDPEAPDRLMDSILDWVWDNAAEHSFDLGKVVGRAISTGGYYAFRTAHRQSDRLLGVAEQGGGCHHMFDPRWIAHQNQMQYPFELAPALAWKFGFRGDDSVDRYMDEGRKFSLLDSGILDTPNCRLLIYNGLEDSIFPIEDSFIVGGRGRKKDLVTLGDRQHMGDPEGEKAVPRWLKTLVSD